MSYCSAKVNGKTYVLVEWNEHNVKRRTHAWIHDLKTNDGARVRGGSQVTIGGRQGRVVSKDDISGIPTTPPNEEATTSVAAAQQTARDSLFSPEFPHGVLRSRQARHEHDDLFSSDDNTHDTRNQCSDNSDIDSNYAPGNSSESSDSPPPKEKAPPRRAKKRARKTARRQATLRDPNNCEIVNCDSYYAGACIQCYKLICHEHKQHDCNHGIHSENTRAQTPLQDDVGNMPEPGTPATDFPIQQPPLAAAPATPNPTIPLLELSPDSPMVPMKRVRGTDQRKERDKKSADNATMSICNGQKCKKNCQAFSIENRVKIRNDFLELDPGIQRRLWVSAHVNEVEVKQRKGVGLPDDSRRQTLLTYTLPLDSKKLGVCKAVFLTTLGYKPNNDSFVRTAMKSQRESGGARPADDRRGKKPPPNKLDPAPIVEHIMSFQPAIPHYRRAHAPKRLYLPTDLNANLMCEMYNTDNPENPVSRYYYSRQLDKLNIGFVKLGGEECDVCFAHDNHLNEQKNNQDHNPETCERCKEYAHHCEKYKLAREAYQRDRENENDHAADKLFISADMQKIIMLPRLPESKKCFFTPRIIAFNETFARLGTLSYNGEKSVAVIWHEGVRGRDGSEVASTFFKFFEINRTKKHITLWTDNCVGQNKNWRLYSMLLYVVNSPNYEIETITIKYFEKGHGRMSADSVHAGIEMELRKTGKVEDFHEFSRVIARSNGGAVIPISMRLGDFKQWDNMFRQNSKERPKIRDIVEAQFRRYHPTPTLFYKRSHADQDFEKFEDIKNEFASFTKPVGYSEELGITEKQKKGIVDQLLPLMQPASRNFWLSEVKTNKRSSTLIEIEPK